MSLPGFILLACLVGGPLAYVLIAQSWCDRRDKFDRLSGTEKILRPVSTPARKSRRDASGVSA